MWIARGWLLSLQVLGRSYGLEVKNREQSQEKRILSWDDEIAQTHNFPRAQKYLKAKPNRKEISSTISHSVPSSMNAPSVQFPDGSVPFVYDGRDKMVLPKQYTPGKDGSTKSIPQQCNDHGG